MRHAGTLTSSPNTPLTGGGLLGSDSDTINYKAEAVAVIKEYMSSSDFQEVSSTLEELNQPQLAHVFVKQVGSLDCTGCAMLCCLGLGCAGVG